MEALEHCQSGPITAPRVLVVEDDEAVRLVLQAFLRLDVPEVAEAVDGLQGWHCALANPPDLLVTDLMMPNLDGLALARRVRERFGDRVKVLVVTGHTEPELPGVLASEGIAFLPKPLKLPVFRAMVQELLGLPATGREG